jgi:hypothetical protein
MTAELFVHMRAGIVRRSEVSSQVVASDVPPKFHPGLDGAAEVEAAPNPRVLDFVGHRGCGRKVACIGWVERSGGHIETGHVSARLAAYSSDVIGFGASGRN